jgi:hypothetical protein
MGFFSHDSKEADAHAEVGVLSPSISIHRPIEADRSLGIYLRSMALNTWHIYRTSSLLLLHLSRYIVNFYPSSYHTLINPFPYQAAKLYKDHCEKNGKPVSHAKTKEFLYVLFDKYLSGDLVSLWIGIGPVPQAFSLTAWWRPKV